MRERIAVDLSDGFCGSPMDPETWSGIDAGNVIDRMVGTINRALGDGYEYVPVGILTVLALDVNSVPVSVGLSERVREVIREISPLFYSEIVEEERRFAET